MKKWKRNILVLSAGLIAGIPAAGQSVLFVTNFDSGTIGECTTSGAVVNASLVTGLNRPTGIAVSGSNLFVVNRPHRQRVRKQPVRHAGHVRYLDE